MLWFLLRRQVVCIVVALCREQRSTEEEAKNWLLFSFESVINSNSNSYISCSSEDITSSRRGERTSINYITMSFTAVMYFFCNSAAMIIHSIRKNKIKKVPIEN